MDDFPLPVEITSKNHSWSEILMGFVWFRLNRFLLDAAQAAANELMCIFIFANYGFSIKNEAGRQTVDAKKPSNI